ncbi:unnamed protein product, partial [Closterium sp. NIES-54]
GAGEDKAPGRRCVSAHGSQHARAQHRAGQWHSPAVRQKGNKLVTHTVCLVMSPRGACFVCT